MTVPVPYLEDFEAGVGGWVANAFTSLCQWQRMTYPEAISVHSDIYGVMVEIGDPRPAYLPSAHSGNSCFWYGNPENGTFIGEPFDHLPFGGPAYTGGNSDDEHGGTLTSPIFETSEFAHIMFSFWTWWEVECIDIDNFDMMYILVSKDAGASWDTLNWLNPPFSRLSGWDHWEGYSSGGYLAPGVWIKWTYFLDASYSGHDIMIRFLFATEDNLYNGFRGWFIDDIYVGGGLQEAQLIRRPEYPTSLGLADCAVYPNPFPLDFVVENIGGEAAEEVMLHIELPPQFELAFGMEATPLGTMTPGEIDTAHWEIEVAFPPFNDTTVCWDIVVTSADSLIGYRDNFEGDENLFTGGANFGYCDVRLPNGPSEAVTGFGIAGMPSNGSATYPPNALTTLTSDAFSLSGWTEAYLAFSYWLSVPPPDLIGWTSDGEDGFLVEIDVNYTGWRQLDEFGVGLLLPRYDAYIDEFSDNPIANKMAYCYPRTGWTEVVSQDLIGMGVLEPDDIVQVRFVFGSNSSDQRAGLFIDEFRLSTVQYPIGPFLHTLCIYIPGTHIPTAALVMPLDGSSSSCPRQEIVVNVGGETMVDPDRVVIWADGEVRFSVVDENLLVDPPIGLVVAQFPENESWVEGWHNVRLDTCFNTVGCNIEAPLVFDFLTDLTAPVADLIDPPEGIFWGDEFGPVTISLFDSLTGVDPSTIALSFCGGLYEVGHECVVWDGGLVTFDPRPSGMSWTDCPQICVIAGDSPDLCAPNTDTTCFDISVIFSPPTAQLVSPPIGAVSACADQNILIALGDISGVADSGAVLLVDGRRYVSGVDPEVWISNDTLVFTPAVNWSHGQTVTGALVEFFNIHGTRNIDTVEFSFIVDLRPPQVTPLVPPVGSIVSDENQIVEFALGDSPAGLDLSTMIIVCAGHSVNGIFSPSTDGGVVSIRPSESGFAFTPGDTVSVHVNICDEPDLCAPNCTTAVWRFFIEPRTACRALPNPFTPNADFINDLVFFDYPHSAIHTAELFIYTLDNIEVFRGNLFGETEWDGRDSRGKPLGEGLYLYIIFSEGRAVCSGSLLIAR